MSKVYPESLINFQCTPCDPISFTNTHILLLVTIIANKFQYFDYTLRYSKKPIRLTNVLVHPHSQVNGGASHSSPQGPIRSMKFSPKCSPLGLQLRLQDANTQTN